jgi:hypothetical protein
MAPQILRARTKRDLVEDVAMLVLGSACSLAVFVASAVWLYRSFF